MSRVVNYVAVSGEGAEDLIRTLGPDVGPGVLLPVFDPLVMSAFNPVTELWVPRRSLRAVSPANQRSRRLVQLAPVGVK